MPRIALATCLVLPEPDPDQAVTVAAFERAGASVQLAAWDDPQVDWSSFDACVIRSTWNYFHRRDAFLAWAEHVARVTRLYNPFRTIAWNTDKKYLRELEGRGVRIAPSAWIDRGSDAPLADIVTARGWTQLVVKPTVSAGSFATVRADVSSPASMAEAERHLRSIVAERDVIVQRYVRSVDGYGERSLVWIDGVIGHAVRKAPRFVGDREQTSTTGVTVADDERAFATKVLAAAAQPDLLYARIDMARDDDGALLLMELEAVEPSLFVTEAPEPLARLVEATLARIAAPR